MNPGAWRTAWASVAGTSHAKTGVACQDAGLCAVVQGGQGEVLVAAVADGAGTAPHSAKGAALAVELFVQNFAEAAQRAPNLAAINRACAEQWLASAQQAIGAMAAAQGHVQRDYACTLLGAVAGPSRSAYFQIGDGAIVVSGRDPEAYDWVFWPQHGEFANMTNFITQDDAYAALAFEADRPAVNELGMFSDGLERLVLDHAARLVHAPAFTPIFRWLAGTPPGASGVASPALLAHLASDHVNARTDDDKTLVMATRLPPA